jgi:methylphosphotriester-DNA--protein-cysteine methyltransferase
LLVEHVRACLRRRLDSASIELQELERVSAWVEHLETDRSISTAAELARHAGLSVRTLQRTLEKHVGIGSKWIVRRARIQHCAELVARGQSVNWADVARELGHHDQAHLIRDFKEQMGLTPQAYAEQCAASAEVRG